MKHAGSIGIDTVSMSNTCFAIYGNDRFGEWTRAEGAYIKRIITPGDGEMTLVVARGAQWKGMKCVANASGVWTRNYTSDQKKCGLPRFGQTKPVRVEMILNELHIVIPPAAKRTKPLRQPRAQIEASKAESVKPANTIEHVMRDILKPPAETVVPATAAVHDVDKLADAIGTLNALARSLDGKVVLCLDPNRMVYARFTITGKEPSQ